jgi:Fe-S oxidoreductase
MRKEKMQEDIYGREIKTMREAIMQCMRCGFCRAVCPVFEETKIESAVARGKLAILEAIIEGSLEPTEGATMRIFQCTTCRNCYVECPAGVEVDRIIQRARVDLAESFPCPAFERITANILERGNPYGEEMLKNIGDSSALAYFPGCTTIFRTPEIADSTLEILKKTGQDFRVLRESCCGSILFRIGRKKEREQLMEKNLEALSGVDTLLVSCVGCYRTFKVDYGNSLEERGTKVVHLAEFLNGLIEEGKMDFSPLKVRMTYHDPCHLGRHPGVYEEPRKVLASIPGVELVEMERNRENARCCGAGGGMASGFKELAAKISRRRVEDALETGAAILTSACPFCYLNLSSQGKGLKIQDISMIVAQQIRD